VIEKLKIVLENMQTGILALWANDGKVSEADSKTCIRLMGQEVVPAIREYGDRIGLKSPFDLETPVSTKFSKDLKPKVAA
jgi:hypothetical protein